MSCFHLEQSRDLQPVPWQSAG